MQTRVCALLLFLLFSFPLTLGAQQAAEIDPVAVSPDKFTVLMENEHVRGSTVPSHYVLSSSVSPTCCRA